MGYNFMHTETYEQVSLPGESIDGVKFSPDKFIAALYAVVNVAIAVVIVHAKAENHTVATLVFLGKGFIFQQILHAVEGIFNAEKAVFVYLIYRKL